MTVSHKPEPDGFCWDCRTVPCREQTRGAKPTSARQLDRIEAKINRLMRAMKIDPDTPHLTCGSRPVVSRCTKQHRYVH